MVTSSRSSKDSAASPPVSRKPRARDLGIPFSGKPGPLNAITDVEGVAVGYSTLWRGDGTLVVGEGPVRTGVTAILFRAPEDHRPCFGSAFALNGAGEVTGLTWLAERGVFDGPMLITNTHSVGVVRDAAIQWMRRQGWEFDWTVPIVGETYDGHFNDINGGHIAPSHVFEALDGARGGPIEEGNVGGGAGMMSYEYKGGTGTASRRLADEDGGYTVGVLVQSNYGLRRQLRIAGLKIGEVLQDDLPHFSDEEAVPLAIRNRVPHWTKTTERSAGVGGQGGAIDGSIIVTIATDAPLLPHQLNRLAKRPALAIGRLGGVGSATSGDIFVAVSTANADVLEAKGEAAAPSDAKIHPNLALTPLFEAVIDATEEAILNALVAGESAKGAHGLQIPRLPHDRVQHHLSRHGLLRREHEQ